MFFLKYWLLPSWPEAFWILQHIRKAMKKIAFRDTHLVWVEPGHTDQFTALPLQQMLRAIKHVTDQETIEVRDNINH